MDRNSFNSLFTSRIKPFYAFSAFWIVVYVIIIFQDYLFSVIRDTGFYWSEVIIYNIFWLLFIPVTLAANGLLSSRLNLVSKQTYKLGISIILSVLTSFIHIILFVSFFTLASQLFFHPPHLFINTFNATISNDLYFPLLVYFIVFMIISNKDRFLLSDVERTNSRPPLKISTSGKTIHVPQSEIICIGADKPYTVIYGVAGKYLSNFSLLQLEKTLDPGILCRVHKSWIINKSHIKELTSRKNGDYDAIMNNEVEIRLSRHYRNQWKELLVS